MGKPEGALLDHLAKAHPGDTIGRISLAEAPGLLSPSRSTVWSLVSRKPSGETSDSDEVCPLRSDEDALVRFVSSRLVFCSDNRSICSNLEHPSDEPGREGPGLGAAELPVEKRVERLRFGPADQVDLVEVLERRFPRERAGPHEAPTTESRRRRGRRVEGLILLLVHRCRQQGPGPRIP